VRLTSRQRQPDRKSIGIEDRVNLKRGDGRFVGALVGSTDVLAPIYTRYSSSPKAAPFFQKQGFALY